MTTKRPKPAAASPERDVRPETLTQFSRTLDAQAGQRVGFSAIVSDLATTRVQLAQLRRDRAEVFEVVKARYAEGHRVVGDGVELRATEAGEPTIVKAVDSAVVKKKAPEAWRRAVAVVSYVSVKPPAVVKMAIAVVPTPVVADNAPVGAAVAAYLDHPAWQRMRELRELETDRIHQLDKIAAEFGWDGLPITFADGWTVGLRRRQFSADKLAQLDAEVYDRLAVNKVKQVSSRVYVARGGVSVGGAVDLDAD